MTTKILMKKTMTKKMMMTIVMKTIAEGDVAGVVVVMEADPAAVHARVLEV